MYDVVDVYVAFVNTIKKEKNTFSVVLTYQIFVGQPDQVMHKNRLQEFTHKSNIPLPIYQTVNEGYQHMPQFRSTVLVNGAKFTSSSTFSTRKAAEQNVAELALKSLSKEEIANQGIPLIQEVSLV